MTAKQDTKITYATMSPESLDDLHRGIDAAIEQIKPRLGETHPIFINGQAVQAADQFDDTSPTDTRLVLGRFQKGTRDHARQAIAAVRAAAPAWSRRPWHDSSGRNSASACFGRYALAVHFAARRAIASASASLSATATRRPIGISRPVRV